MLGTQRLDRGDPLRDRIVAKAGGLRKHENGEAGLRALRICDAAQRHAEKAKDDR